MMSMGQNTIVLKWSLLAGALYFFTVACVHLVGFKVPVLYIYFDEPSSVYQNRIISFLAFGLAAYFLRCIANLKNTGVWSERSCLSEYMLYSCCALSTDRRMSMRLFPAAVLMCFGLRRRVCFYTGCGFLFSFFDSGRHVILDFGQGLLRRGF
jgi:hypothetical protein